MCTYGRVRGTWCVRRNCPEAVLHVGEVRVERRARAAGLGDHVLDRALLVAPARHDADHRLEEPLARPRARLPLGEQRRWRPLRAGAQRRTADRLTHHGATTLAGRAGQSPPDAPRCQQNASNTRIEAHLRDHIFRQPNGPPRGKSQTPCPLVFKRRARPGHGKHPGAAGRGPQKSAQFQYAGVRRPGATVGSAPPCGAHGQCDCIPSCAEWTRLASTAATGEREQG